MKGLEKALPTYASRIDELIGDASTDASDACPSDATDDLDSAAPNSTAGADAVQTAEEEYAPEHSAAEDPSVKPRRKFRRPWNFRTSWSRVVGFVIMPALVLLLAAGVAYLKWRDVQAQQSHTAAIQAVPAATETAIAMLSYQPDTVDKELTAARGRLTGAFRDEYTKLIEKVVIPGAKEKRIAVTATSPAAGLVSATATKAVVLVYIDQTTIIGSGAPTDTASSVLVTVQKEGGKWLVSKFDPI